MSLTWNGEQVQDKVLLASARAGNSILGDSVITSKQLVPVRTTHLQGSIQMREMAMTSAKGGLRGMFGSFAMHYAIYVEKGTRPHFPPIDAIAMGMKVDRNTAFLIARSISKKGTKAYPYLQPSADKWFPQLASRIKQEFASG